mgnify:CR=1 FL=1|tara:strand:- start:3084 stop:3986 length:903 start_codon:yes stop_codon:yes gene_type:complete
MIFTKIFIFGFGYTAAYFSDHVVQNNHNDIQIVGTSRNVEKKHSDLIKLDIQDHIKLINYDKKSIIQELKNSDIVLISIPPNIDGVDVVYKEYSDFLIKNKKNIKWLGYLSATSVYGNYNGEWVDEKSKCKPSSKRGKDRLSSEKQWMQLFEQHKIPVNIFRISGIYGPSKSAIERVKQKYQDNKYFTINKKDHFFSRIHVKDISSIIYETIKKNIKGEIFNLSDDLPASSADVDDFAANLLKYPRIKKVCFDKADLSPMALEFYQDNKKVSNNKVKSLLNYKFIFSDYKEGLKNINLIK